MKHIAVALDLNNAFDRQVMSGIAQFAQAHDWEVTVDDEISRQSGNMVHWQGDGIIAMTDRIDIATLPALDMPFIAVGASYTKAMTFPFFGIDNQAIGEMAADHISTLGISHFAYCDLATDKVTLWSQHRGDAFLRGIGVPSRTERFSITMSFPYNWQAKTPEIEWLKNLPKPCALFCACDHVAKAVTQVARTIGLSIPHDLVVVGVDNDELLCSLVTPNISSIATNTGRLGYQAAQAMEQWLSNDVRPAAYTTIEPLGLIERESSQYYGQLEDDIQRAVQWVGCNLNQAIRPNDVADAADISRSSLEKKFVDQLGMTPNQFIIKRKLDEAKRLLSQTSLSLYEISAQLAFKTVQYFMSVFKRHERCTPNEYRQQHRLS